MFGAVLVSLVTGLYACTPSPADRFEAQRELGDKVVEAGVFALSIDPGAEPNVSSEEPLLARFWASGPTPTIILNHGQPGFLDLRVILDNTFSDARMVPTMSALRDPSYPGCQDRGVQQRLVLDEIPYEEGEPLLLAIHECTTMSLRTLPPEGLGEIDGEEIQVAVFGETHGNLPVFRKIVQDSNEWPADLVIGLGNLANSAARLDLLEFRDETEALDAPLAVALGSVETQAGSPLPFHEIYGRSDFTFVIGDVRFLFMDTANGTMAENQFEYWSSVLPSLSEPVIVAFMQLPPLDPSGTRNEGFTNRNEAARLVALLGDGGVDEVFTGGGSSYRLHQLGGLFFHSTGGGGSAIEATSSYAHHYLQVTIRPGDSSPVQVDVVEI